MRNILSTAAVLALAVTTVHAKPGDNPGKPGPHAESPGRAKEPKASRGPGGPGKGNAKAERTGGPQQARDMRGDAPKVKPGKGPGEEPGRLVERGRDKAKDAGPRWREEGDVRGPAHLLERRVASRRFAEGCPPGLAKKFNGCMPPGLAKQRYERRYYRPDWWGFSSLRDGRYFYRDGYLLRFGSDNRITGFVPLLAGALSRGSTWPSFYEPRPLSPYYVDYFDLSPRSYRYADNVIYRVDPESAAIMSVAALLTGDQFTVGQRLPAGYSVYNVPYAYRDRYYDRPDAHYRYADGYIYQVDPKTMLIASAISLAL